MKRASGALALLAVLVPILLLVLNSNEGWHSNPGLWKQSRYLINSALMVWLALDLVLVAFLARKSGKKPLAALGLLTASAIFWLAVVDIGIVLFNNQTTGPGGALCLTHRNWYERVVTKNSLGFWEREPSEIEGSPVIVAMGDSFTFGQGLPQRSLRYTDRIASALPQAALINVSRGGLNTREQINLLLPAVKKVDPDIVLFFYLTNDIHDAIGHPQPEPLERSKWAHRLLVASPSWNYLYWRLFAAMEFEAGAVDAHANLIACYEDPENFSEHQEDLARLVSEIKAMGARPLAVMLPYPHLWTGVEETRRRPILDKIEQALSETGTPVLRLDELEKTYPVGEFEVNGMDAHPDAEVHAAIADKVIPWLKEQLQSPP